MKNILIIYTGGTIGMVIDPQTGVLKPLDFDQIIKNVPDLERLNCRLKFYSFDAIIDSSNMNPVIWTQLAAIVEQHYQDIDGFVILHGSDTMAFSASALSFMFENLSKPIIFTGSQLPITAIRSDARENLIAALEITLATKDDKALVPEVCIYFDNKLFRGNRSFKYNSAKFEAFRSPNYPVLAEAGVHLQFNENYIRKNGSEELRVHKNLATDIAVLKLYPGISHKVVETILEAAVRVVIMETFGAGNATTERWFIELLKKAVDSGKVILNISQCKVGTVELGRYETSRQLKEMGVANGYDMTFEAAITKTMHILGQENDAKGIVHMLEQDLRGELTIS
ncbi:MAG: asparaginase [Sphingobacteriaceae bacterium]